MLFIYIVLQVCYLKQQPQHMWLLKFLKSKMRVQFLTYTTHIPITQQPHVARGYFIGHRRIEHFHYQRKFCGLTLFNKVLLCEQTSILTRNYICSVGHLKSTGVESIANQSHTSMDTDVYPLLSHLLFFPFTG